MGSVIVVGGGISGVTCARTLVAAGHTVTVLDRGRVLGGRMASRRYDGRPVDIGASYFTVSDPAFQLVVDDWQRRGLARPWTDTFTAISADGEDSKAGPMRWAAGGGLRGLVEDLAAGLTVEQQITVDTVDLADGLDVDGRSADAVVLAMPDPQAWRLLSPRLAAEGATLTAEFEPVLVLTTIWPRRGWAPRDGIFVNDDDVLSWIADDGLRRGDGAPVLVAHSTPGYARPRLDEPARWATELTDALRRVLGIAQQPSIADVHRWTFGKPTGHREEPYLLTDSGLGVCGDSWSMKPRVEAAYLSGVALGAALARRLGPHEAAGISSAG